MRVIRANEQGIALLLVLSALTVLSVLAITFAYSARISATMAANYRDQVKARYLALSGLRFYELIFRIDRTYPQIKDVLGTPLVDNPLLQNVDSLWMRLIADQGRGDAEELLSTAESEDDLKKVEAHYRNRTVMLESTNLLDRFEGDFTWQIQNECSRYSLNRYWQASEKDLDTKYREELAALFEPQKFRAIFEDQGKTPNDIIDAIFDWVDINTERFAVSGPEDVPYDRGDDPYQAKNSAFDSPAELRLVDGVNDAFMTLFGKRFTTYCRSTYLSPTDTDLIVSLVRRYASDESLFDEKEGDVRALITGAVPAEEAELDSLIIAAAGWQSADEFVAFAKQVLSRVGLGIRDETVNLDGITFDKPDPIYRLTLQGQVGRARDRISVVIDASANDPRQFVKLYWRTGAVGDET